MAWLDEFRKVNPWASEHSDDFVVRYAANNMGMNPHTLAYQAGVDLDNSSDAVKSLKAGVWNAVTAPVGLANIPVAMVTGHNLVSDGWGEIGKITGVQPSRWADEARYAQSPELQAERQAIDNAWQNGSFLDAAAETLQRPSALGHTLLESAPSMVGGLGLAKGLLSAGARGVARGAAGPALPGFLERQFGARAAAIAAGAGEGAFAGGQAMERSAQNPNIDPHTGALAALGTMATTGALGYLGGRLGDKIGGKFGVGDMEADILRGKFLHSSAPVYKRAPMAMLQEGVLEEAPQSALEQGWQNLAEGKPLTEGMGRQAFEGGLAGAALGGGMKLPGWYSKPATAKPGEPIDLLPRSEPAHDASALQEPVQPVGLNPIRGIYNDPAPNNADSMRAALDEVTGMVGDRQITAWEELQAAHPGVFPKFKSLAPTAPLAEEPQAPAAPKLTKRAAKMQATITSMVENGASEVELAHATELMQANKLGELNTFAKQVAEVRSEPVPIMPVPPEVALQQKAQEQQAQQALPAVAAQQPAVAPVLDAGEVISGVGPLPEVQGAVWQHLMKALNNGDLNDYIDSGNVIQYTKIADELGLDRGSVKMAVNGVMNRIAKTQGVSVDQVKSAMRSSVAGVRTTEMAPYDALGLHPEAQSRVNEAESYLGGEGGQVQTMGVINSIRGSQGKIGPNEAPPGYEWSAAPSENAQRHAQMERALAPREEGTLLPAGDAAILDAVAKRVLDAQLVDVQDAREEYDGGLQRDDASFDQLSFEHRVQFVRAYISWNDNVLSAPEFNRVREGIADEYRTKVKRGAQDQQRGAPLQVSDSGRHQERPALASAVGNGGDSVVPRSEVPADGRGLSNPDESWRDLDHTDTIHYSESNGVANPSSVDKIHAVIDKAFFTPARARSLVEVYATQEEAAAHYADQLSQAKGKVQAFVTQDGKIVMIAGNIAEGHEMAVFLHEVGVHVGMEKLIGKANYKWLTQQVEQWAQRDDGSLEARIAKQAIARAENSSSKDKRAEIVAYTVEGLVDAGVTPQAAGQTEAHRWFRKLWAAAKVALRRLGFKNPDQLTGQNLVDLAYGAADLELRGASQIGARQDSDSIRFSQDENDDLDFTQPSSTIELRKRGTPTPKGIARAKKLYGGAEGYARYDEAAKEFFDYVKPWVDRTALKGRTDIQALVQRLRVASDARYKELSSSDTDGTGNGMLRSKSSGIGGLGGYSTVFDDSEGSPSLIVVTDDQIARAKKEAAEYGLKASDVLHAQGETLRLVMHDDGELVIYGPRADTKYFQDLKAEGLADVCRDADGNILYLADGVPWTRLTKATFTELIPLLADMHARIRLYTGREHTGVWWRRATGATGNAGTNPLEERSGAIYFSEAAEGPTRAPQLGNYAEATIAERIKYSMEKAGILANKALHKVVFLTDLVDIAEKAGLKSARAFERFVGEKDEIRTRIEEQYGRIMERAAALKDKNLVDAFLRASTIDGKWGYDDNPHKVKADPEMAKQFAGLSAEGQRVVREIFATGNEMYSRIRSLAEAETRREYGKLIAAARGNDAKAADLQKDLQKSLASIERSMPKRDTPYAPLKRFGDYLVTFKSKDYLVAEADGNQKRMREMKGQGHHYQVWAFEDAAEAAFQADKLRTQTDGEVRNFHKQESYKQLDELPWSAVAKVKNAIDNDPDSKNSTALKKLVTDMYLQMLAETSARKSEMNRQKVVGSGEMLRAFAAHGRSTAHFVASMAKSGEIANAMTDMKAEAHGNTDRNTVYNELAQRYARSLDFNPTPVADKMMRITSMWMLLTSPAYYINNMTQPFMLTLPVLGGTYRGRAWPALVQAYKDVAKYVGKMGVELDLNSLPISADEKAMLSTLRDQGKIDITVASDMGRWAEGEVDQGPFARVSHLMSSAVSKVEALNRIVSALAAYRLSGGSVEYAGKVIDRTQGNYSSTNAPRFFAANGATKLITQFRKYQLIQLSLIGRLLHTSFAGASADEKLAARKAFAWMFAQHLAVTGLKGAPLAAVGMMLAAAIGGDDDKDWERNLRRWIGDDDVATVLIRGIPAGLGLDVSERIGMSNTFSLLPFAEMPADRTGYEKAAASALGPASALVGNAFDAWGKMRNGQYSKAVELLSPSLIKNSLQGYRIATDGITDSRGNVRLNADEISFFDGFMQAVGLPTTAKTEFQNKRGDLIELSKHFDSREDRIRAQYINAKRTGDTGEMAEAREAWQEVQRSKREWMTSMRDRGFTNPALLKQLKPRPLASLLKAPQRQAQQDRAWSSVSMR